MREHVTLVAPPLSPAGGNDTSSLPPDLLRQVRGRVRAIAVLMMIAFAIDPFFYFLGWLTAPNGSPLPDEFHRRAPFIWASSGIVLGSTALWRVASSPRISPHRLLTVGFIYQVALCFAIALTTFLEYWGEKGILPNLTWVPAVVILFPLLLPGPPRRTIVASTASAAMPPIVLGILAHWGAITVGLDDYINTSINGAIAVGLAAMGSRVVYGLGRAVKAAREMGSYRLEEKLGAGGMGEVWRANHRLLARPAALKLIRRPDAGGQAAVPAEARLRFEREAQVIARLRSPHTVTLFDFGVADDGTFYYAMELLDGLDADKFVRRFGAMTPPRVVHVLRQICHSLSEAESCGLVHRDIKPANIFLCRYGEDVDFVKVLDFGLVKAFGAESDTASILTRDHVIAGTPAFMAPEQALGAPVVDSRADIYATGCVAYWLLTGHHVFDAETPMGLLLHHAHTAPVPPAARARQALPLELDRIVMACLAKAPEDRPQTARELSAWLAESRLEFGWSEDHAREWWSTHLPIRPAVATPNPGQ